MTLSRQESCIDYFVPQQSTQGSSDIDYLLTEKTCLLLQYDLLQKHITSCGFSIQLKDFFTLSSQLEADPYSHHRLNLSMLKGHKAFNDQSLKKLSFKTVEHHQMILHEIFSHLIHDYQQLGILFLEKLGNSHFTESLLERLKIHQVTVEKLKIMLTKYQERYL